MSDDDLGDYWRGHPSPAERRIAKLEERLDSVLAALRTGDVCGSIGHTFHLPTAVIRSRIELADWKIERRCALCGEPDGVWQAKHWTLQEFVDDRKRRIPQPKVAA